MRARAESPLRRTIRRLAARQEGLANDEVVGATVRQVARVVQHLIEDGQLHKARLTGKNVRYFKRSTDAEAWLGAVKLARIDPVTGTLKKRAIVEPDDTSAPWPADAMPYFPHHEDGSPAWKHTVYKPSMLGIFSTNTHRDTH